MNTNTASLGNMPVELFLYIASFTTRSDKRSLIASCKSFKNLLLEDLWAEDVAGVNDALFWGCKVGDVAVVERAIELGAPVTTIRKRMDMLVREFTHVPMGRDERIIKAVGVTPLGQAIMGIGSAAVIAKLLEHGVSPRLSGDPLTTCMELALYEARDHKVDWCPIDVVKLLLQHGAEVPENYNNALRLCFDIEHHEDHCCSDCTLLIAEELLRRGMKPNMVGDDWYGPVWTAVQRCYYDIRPLELLLRFNADPSVNGRHGQPLVQVIECAADLEKYESIPSENCLAAFELLLEHGALPRALPEEETGRGFPDDHVDPLDNLIFSSIENKVPFLNLLIEYGGSVNNPRTYWTTRLSGATQLRAHRKLLRPESPDLRTMEWLLEAGVDPNEKDDNGMTAYDYAGTTDSFEAMELLVKYGAEHKDRLNILKDGEESEVYDYEDFYPRYWRRYRGIGTYHSCYRRSWRRKRLARYAVH